MKWEIKSSIPVEYNIELMHDILKFNWFEYNRKIIVVDKIFYNLYKDEFDLTNASILLVECTESTKSIDHAYKILSFFEDQKVLRRSEPIIIIGGGVLLDLVGFCCSVYRRGIPYIRVPTTLLSMVDASVGVKTSINIFEKRNRVGNYYPPLKTLIDHSFIKTQDNRQIANGFAEIIKLAIICDLNLFEMLEERLDITDISKRAIGTMVDQLKDNLWETNLQRPVDFGHTFSPIVEMKNINNLFHGEAVILDCLFSSYIAYNRNLITTDELSRIKKMIISYDLPITHEDFLNPDLIYQGLQDTISHRNGNQFVPLPNKIGACIIVNNITLEEINVASRMMYD